MKLFHTSDWHLGRSLYTRKRYTEFQLFLDWLIEQISIQKPDLLIIAGDIFDTTTPSNKAQEMYYQFLCKVATTTQCNNIVVIGGNHDSPTLLNAPKELLKQLNIHVVGNISENPQDEIIEIKNNNGNVIALVCAVPFLRDKDIRELTANESTTEKDVKFMTSIKEHYNQICKYAISKRQYLKLEIPIIATGHLFVTGGHTLKDDGVRELYVGSLAQFGSNDFPNEIDYLALGHLHIPQKISNKDNQRYSGSPIAMGFGEASQQKIILQVEFNNTHSHVTEILIPVFQQLQRINGNIEALKSQLNELIALDKSIWVEANYTGKEIIHNLQHELANIVINTKIELIKIYNSQLITQILSSNDYNTNIELNDLTPHDVFDRCLTINQIPEDQQIQLKEYFKQIISEINLTDIRAE